MKLQTAPLVTRAGFDLPGIAGKDRSFPSRLAALTMALTLLLANLASAAGPVSAKVSAKVSGSSLIVTMVIPEGYHAQSHTPLDENFIKTVLKLTSNPAVDFGEVVYPPPRIEKMAGLGDVSVYNGSVEITAPLYRKPGVSGEVTIKGSVGYQICDDKACLAPDSSKFSVTVDSATLAPAPASQPSNPPVPPKTPPTTAPTPAPATQPSPGAAGSSISSPPTRAGNSFLYMLGAAFAAGVIFNVMPCVLPVLPIKAIGFYEASEHDRGKTMMLGASFSAGLLSVFAMLAVFVLLSQKIFGQQISWGQWFSSPVFVWVVVGILVLLGIGMFRSSAVNLPGWFYMLNPRHDTMGGNFAWGILTAFLSTPCTAPLFPFVLGVAITQPLVLGTMLILMVGVGMAMPYFILSAFPELARNFPRAGPAGELVKQMAGFLMFGTAAFFAGTKLNIANASAWMIFGVTLWASAFLVARTSQFAKTPLALLVSTAIAALCTGGSLWFALPSTEGQVQSGVTFVDYSDTARDSALKNGQPVLVKFTAKWCANCEVLERTVYKDQRIVDLLNQQNVVAMKLDVDKVGWDLHRQLAPGEGIPFTALFVPGISSARTLPSMHTTQNLIDFINSSVVR